MVVTPSEAAKQYGEDATRRQQLTRNALCREKPVLNRWNVLRVQVCQFSVLNVPSIQHNGKIWTGDA